jgi:predicted nucleic acid-binding protein
MQDVVLDASYVLKWILSENEVGVEEVREMQKKMIDGGIRALAPAILLAEIINVLFWKKKFITGDILDFLGLIGDGRIQIVPLDSFEPSEILEMMNRRKVGVYDAYYLVLAEKYKCKLMSFDKKLG